MKGTLSHRIKSILSTPEYIKVLILRTLGNFLIFSSIFMIAKTFYLPFREEIRYAIESRVEKKYIVVDTLTTKPDKVDEQVVQKGGLAQLLNIKQVEVLAPQNPEFSVVVPKIGANAQILPNIDPTRDSVYLEALKQGVAHAAGTSFPGEGGHIFLFAHSTDYFWNVGSYNAVFYLLYKLEKQDEINVFYQGTRHVYRVIDKKVVDPQQVEYLTRKTNKEFLTLQTCWPPGTTLKRLLVFAVRVAE